MEMRPVGVVTALGCLRAQGTEYSMWGEHDAEEEGIRCPGEQTG